MRTVRVPVCNMENFGKRRYGYVDIKHQKKNFHVSIIVLLRGFTLFCPIPPLFSSKAIDRFKIQ